MQYTVQYGARKMLSRRTISWNKQLGCFGEIIWKITGLYSIFFFNELFQGFLADMSHFLSMCRTVE